VIISGGLPHHETAKSGDLELIEVCVPAKTVAEAYNPT